jgi:sporulation protein YlmC with PRC-barrel domain
MRTAAKTGMLGLLAFGTALCSTAVVRGAEPEKPAAKILVAKTFQASKLIGLNVRNKEGEKLGTVNDLVLNIETGKIAYVALSVGGVLGVGDKLFAVPYNQMAFDHGKDEQFFVLDMAKERLDAAPGFNQSDWPKFADPNWTDKIDTYYTRERTEVRTKSVK